MVVCALDQMRTKEQRPEGQILSYLHLTVTLSTSADSPAYVTCDAGDLLEGLLQQSRFPSLALRLRMQLLSGLSSAVSALSAKRSVSLLTSLPQLCRCSSDGRASAGSAGVVSYPCQNSHRWVSLCSQLQCVNDIACILSHKIAECCSSK